MAIVHQLGELFLGAVPTVLLILIFYFILKSLFFKPLLAVMAEREALSPRVFDAWNELWVGAALAHDRFMRVEVTERRDRGDPCWRWKFG